MIIPLVKFVCTENYYAQHAESSLGLVALAEYQKHGAAAPPSVQVSIYRELLAAKDLGLLLVSFDRATVSREHAESLVKSCLMIYTQALNWPQTFNERPSEFDYNAFLEAINGVKC